MDGARDSRHEPSARERRRLLPAVCALVSCVLLAACADTEPHRIETCTSVVNGINIGVEAIDVMSTVIVPGSDDVKVSYRIRSGGQPSGKIRWVMCRFEVPELGDSKPDLNYVETQDGPLGDGRLFVLKRWWLDYSFASWQRDEG